MGIKQTLIQSADNFVRLSYDERVKKMYAEVAQYAASQANVGHYVARFDAFWDVSKETREVCRMLSGDGILVSVIDFDDGDITKPILSGDEVGLSQGIYAIYLAWRDQ